MQIMQDTPHPQQACGVFSRSTNTPLVLLSPFCFADAQFCFFDTLSAAEHHFPTPTLMPCGSETAIREYPHRHTDVTWQIIPAAFLTLGGHAAVNSASAQRKHRRGEPSCGIETRGKENGRGRCGG
eukprot:TRINITY_DN6372_c1_g2_i1.p1 TRINITY_DN6372_c1_g2~~TRINITY_DN6372_c1_g2_i1.p1  ORF type:complete len:136 (-),score=6.45 TRINITY_DN6372_c1_g2_i1:715-1092(-)